jgi:co-chaperonin GroES (HSP10)
VGFEYKQKLLNDMLVVEIVEATPTRIRLPDWQRVLKGYVRAAGPGRMLTNGKRAKMACKVGDYVSFAATAGMDTVYAGTQIRMLKDEDIDAVFPGKREKKAVAA